MKFQDAILPGSEQSLNPNSKLAQIMVDDETYWPDASVSGTNSEEQFDLDRKNFSCKTCDKLILEEPTPHVNASIQSSLLSCVTCAKQFLTIVELYVHFKLAHPQEHCPLLLKEKQFCGCKKQSDKTEILPVKPKKVKKVQFKVVCDYCEKDFRSKKILEIHIKEVHLNIKENPCNICGKMFARKSERDKHMQRIHAKLTQYGNSSMIVIFPKVP